MKGLIRATISQYLRFHLSMTTIYSTIAKHIYVKITRFCERQPILALSRITSQEVFCCSRATEAVPLNITFPVYQVANYAIGNDGLNESVK